MDKNIIYILFVGVAFLFVKWMYNTYFPRIKGAMGEYNIVRRLRQLNRKKYRVYNDIYLKIKGRSTQIDHLIISIYGIFVIETKNYKGWIHGHENAEFWTQSIFKSKTKFRNPIKQNWAHVYFLKNALSDFPQNIYHPIVVFVGTAKLKNIQANAPVIYKHKLLKTIKKHRIPVLTTAQVEDIEKLLKGLLVSEKGRKRDHKRFVRSNIDERNRKIKALECPNCGGQLIRRVGNYGKFYGCSNYPRCKFSKNV